MPMKTGPQRPRSIPTVLDRFLQQALLQALQPEWDTTFSEGNAAKSAVDRPWRRTFLEHV
jgi:hypothetical protein